MLAHLNPTDRALELGCGTGSTALRLAPSVKHYVATDISDTMIEIAKDKAWEASIPGLSFKTTREMEKNGTRWTRVLAFNLLHLLPNLDAALAEIRDKLEPGGLFISKTPCLANRWYLKPVIAAMRVFNKAPWVAFLDVQELEEKIAAAGFEIVQTGLYPPSVPSSFVVARRN